MQILLTGFSDKIHYGSRTAPWIKLHRRLLAEHRFMSLPADDQMLLIGLWLLACENPLEDGCGVLDTDLEELRFRLPAMMRVLRRADPLARLVRAGFIETPSDGGERATRMDKLGVPPAPQAE